MFKFCLIFHLLKYEYENECVSIVDPDKSGGMDEHGGAKEGKIAIKIYMWGNNLFSINGKNLFKQKLFSIYTQHH